MHLFWVTSPINEIIYMSSSYLVGWWQFTQQQWTIQISVLTSSDIVQEIWQLRFYWILYNYEHRSSDDNTARHLRSQSVSAVRQSYLTCNIHLAADVESVALTPHKRNLVIAQLISVTINDYNLLKHFADTVVMPLHPGVQHYKFKHINMTWTLQTEDKNLSSATTDWSDNPYKAVCLSLVQK